jgi:hypothetical protein
MIAAQMLSRSASSLRDKTTEGHVLPAKFSPSRVVSPPGFTGSLLSVLRPLLTPVPARQPFLATAPTITGRFGRQVSLSKDVNSRCTTGPFTSGAEHRAALCCARSPAPSTLYGLSVRRLISFDRWLPSHETSRFRSCFGLVLWAKLSPVMRASLTAFPYRGLSPHQFTPKSGAHNRSGADAGRSSRFAFRRLCSGRRSQRTLSLC